MIESGTVHVIESAKDRMPDFGCVEAAGMQTVLCETPAPERSDDPALRKLGL